MAAIQQMPFFDDSDSLLFGDNDFFGNSVPCIAGELELQVQSYEGVGELPNADSSVGKSFALAKNSGGSSLSALAVADFGDADFMDNVSLDDLAAADHYGHTVCGRQSTADSGSGRNPSPAGGSWCSVKVEPAPPSATVAAESEMLPHEHELNSCYAKSTSVQQHAQESSDCDMSHTAGDGESSGVGPGKSVVLGSSHSESSEDNTAGVAPSPCNHEEEQISMPNFGLSLSRLKHGGAATSERGHPSAQPNQHDPKAASISRAFSVDNFALAGAASAAGLDPSASDFDGLQRRAQVVRSYSYVSPDTLPMEFSLGCGNAFSSQSLSTRGRCASLNETQLRQHWLQEGELLAPQLPPSVSELELLELPEDAVPVRPARSSLLMHPPTAISVVPAMTSVPQPSQPSDSEISQGKTSGITGSATHAGTALSQAPAQPTMTVKRKVITSPSPLLQPGKPSKARHAASMGPSIASSTKVQSPKRVKVGSGAAVSTGSLSTWQDGAAPASSAGVLAGWHPARPSSGVSIKTVRSMPANMNSFLEGVEVTVEPLDDPDSGAFSASTVQQSLARGAFLDGSGATAGPRGAMSLPPAGKTGRAKAAPMAGPAAGAMMPGAGMSGGFFAPGMVTGPDGRRLCPVPGVPKPRKRASPNGNPPKAPAPNPNGHCCTQCGTQTTPVWRAGPHGPKTLCNACGVRYMKVAKGNVVPIPRRQQQQH